MANAFQLQKCKVMHFGRDNIKYVYEMNGVCLEAVSVERDLGIEI